MVRPRLSGQADARLGFRLVPPVLDNSSIMEQCRQSLGRGVVRVQLQSATEQPQGLIIRRFGERIVMCQGLHEEVVGVEIMGRLRGGPLDLRPADARLNGSDDTLRDAVLQVEDVGEFAVEPVSPDVPPIGRFDQLPRDPNPAPGLSDGTLQHVAHAEFPADLSDVHGPALVGEGRVPGDHEEPAHPGQGGDDVLDHPVGKVLLLRVATHVGEGQDGQGWSVRKRQGRPRTGGTSVRRSGLKAIDPHRPRDVLDLLLPLVLEGVRELVPDLLVDLARNRDAARLRDLLQSGCDIHPVAVDVPVGFNDDVAQVDADPELEGLGRFPRTRGSKALLDLCGASHGLDGAGELNQDAIASGLYHAPLVVIDLRLEHLPAQVLDPRQGSFLVLPHQGGEAHHVSREDRRKAPLGLLIRRNRHPILPCRCRGVIVLRQTRSVQRQYGGIARRLRDGEVRSRPLPAVPCNIEISLLSKYLLAARWSLLPNAGFCTHGHSRHPG